MIFLLMSSQLPEVRALKFNVAYYDRESVSPGYWFVAPYGVIDPEAPTKQWKPCQVGPYIYDADGVRFLIPYPRNSFPPFVRQGISLKNE